MTEQRAAEMLSSLIDAETRTVIHESMLAGASIRDVIASLVETGSTDDGQEVRDCAAWMRANEDAAVRIIGGLLGMM